ncbi:MAG: type IV pilus assembly protein PilM [Acidimicrobiales bacterium]
MAQVVGLDIATSAVRAAEIDTGSTPPTLLAFGQIGLPPGSIVDGEIQDPSAVSDAIGRLWRNGQFASKSVVIGIAGLRAITREIDLPFVPDDEIDSAVQFQSEEVIPFPPDKTILSAQVLADFAAPDGTAMRRVLVAAAHRDLVEGVVSAVEGAGLTVEGVDLVSSALVRALVDPKTMSDSPEAIVSVGAGLTVVVVHQHGRPQFVRTVGIGGNATTAAVASALDLPLADAEALKRRLGEPVPQVQAAERAARASMSELVGEIRNSIQYFASLPGRAPISRVLLTGGGSRVNGLVETLQAQVRIPVQVVSALSRLDLRKLDQKPEQLASIDPVATTPIGLALPEPNPSVQKFNLIPPEVKERSFQRMLKRRSILVGATVIVLLLLGGVLQYLRYHFVEGDVRTATAQISTLQAQIPKYDRVVKATDELRQAQGQITAVSSSSVDWYAVLTELTARTPRGLSSSSFTGTSGAAAAPGVATPGAGPSGIGSVVVSVSGSYPTDIHFSPVAEWIDNLSASPFFYPPEVSQAGNTVTGHDTTVTFQSTVHLQAGASLSDNGSF